SHPQGLCVRSTGARTRYRKVGDRSAVSGGLRTEVSCGVQTLHISLQVTCPVLPGANIVGERILQKSRSAMAKPLFTRFRPPIFENPQLPKQLLLDCQSPLLGSARRY